MRHALLLIATIATATACSLLSPDRDSGGLLPVEANYYHDIIGRVDSLHASLTPDDLAGVGIVKRDLRVLHSDGVHVETWRFARGDDGRWWGNGASTRLARASF